MNLKTGEVRTLFKAVPFYKNSKKVHILTVKELSFRRENEKRLILIVECDESSKPFKMFIRILEWKNDSLNSKIQSEKLKEALSSVFWKTNDILEFPDGKYLFSVYDMHNLHQFWIDCKRNLIILQKEHELPAHFSSMKHSYF